MFPCQFFPLSIDVLFSYKSSKLVLLFNAYTLMAKIYTIFWHLAASLVLHRVMKLKLFLYCIFSTLQYSFCEECMSESDCLSTYRSVYYCADLICPNDTSTSTTTVSTTPLQNPETHNSQALPPSPTTVSYTHLTLPTTPYV